MNVEKSHTNAFVKVNAPVDAGIAPVVEALSLFPKVCTTASCEGKLATGGGFVWFRYGADDDNAHDAADFLCWLGCELSGRRCELTAEWGGGQSLRFCLSLPKTEVAAVAQVLRDAASSYAAKCSTERLSGARRGPPRRLP